MHIDVAMISLLFSLKNIFIHSIEIKYLYHILIIKITIMELTALKAVKNRFMTLNFLIRIKKCYDIGNDRR